jgi:hypothetical protein
VTVGIPERGLVARQERWPHGVRARYVAGCRCEACRRSNTLYAQARARAKDGGDWNGLVPADRAREHLRKLRRQGVGLRMVAEVTGLSRSILMGIARGGRARLCARSERKILRVTPAVRGDGALVPAAATWRRIEWLIEEGFTKGAIAKALGAQWPALQLRRTRVTVRTAAKVERLYRRYAA